ncbi:DUF4340 domain-containing protein [Spirochaetia bacterium 38H-sp]|uniref:DUF4340 domain-containing protein n=1 Tax=Rarispira pelagica TaxID=3141764 RepID=A0ABU9UBY5_9SPIR
MNRKSKLILLATATAAIVLLLLLIPVLKNKPQAESTTNKTLYVVSLNREDITKIKIDKTNLVFIKQDTNEDKTGLGTWTTEKNAPYKIDESSITSTCYSLTGISADRIIEEEAKDLSIYGLDKPQASITLTDKNNNVQTIFLGNKTPTGSGYYAKRKSDNTVYVIYNYLAEKFFTKLSDFRDKSLTSIDSSKLKHILLERKSLPDIEILEKTEEDQPFMPLARYKIIKPFAYTITADPQKLESFINPLSSIRIENFADISMAEAGLDNPDYRLTLKDDKNNLTLLIGKQTEDGKYYAKTTDSSEIFTIRNITDALTKDAKDIADTFIFLVDIKNTKEFMIKFPDRTYTAMIKRIEKEEKTDDNKESKQIEEHFYVNGQEIEEKAFRQFFQQCIGITADSWSPDENISGKSEISMYFKVETEKGDMTKRIDYIPYKEGFYAAKRDSKTYFIVSERQIKSLRKAVEEVLTHTVN